MNSSSSARDEYGSSETGRMIDGHPVSGPMDGSVDRREEHGFARSMLTVSESGRGCANGRVGCAGRAWHEKPSTTDKSELGEAGVRSDRRAASDIARGPG